MKTISWTYNFTPCRKRARKIQFEFFKTFYKNHFIFSSAMEKKMDLFQQLRELATRLEDELVKIETGLRVVLMQNEQKYDGPADKSLDVHDEIKELSKKVDILIHEATEQSEHFDGFLNGMIDTVTEYEEKIQAIQKVMLNYGFKGRLMEPSVDLRQSLEEIENEQKASEKSENDEIAVDSPNILQLGLVSKRTLQNLGYKVTKEEDTKIELKSPSIIITDNDQEAPKVVEDSLIEESPLNSILKKNFKKKANFIDYSQIEISPGLFVKRPSSKTKKEKEPAPVPPPPIPQPPVNQYQSPEMPKLKTINLEQIMARKSQIFNEDLVEKTETKLFQSKDFNKENETESPPIPQLNSQHAQLLLSGKKPAIKANIIRDKEDYEYESPEVPQLHSYEAQVILSSKKSARSPIKLPPAAAESHVDSPEMPSLKTVNLAALLKQAKGTNL